MLATRIGATYLHGPPDEMSRLRSLVDRQEDRLRPLFYAVGNALCSRQAQELLDRRPVVMDRYIYTTVAWHTALGLDVKLPWGELDLLRPDIGFLLTSDEQTRQLRLRSRSQGMTASDMRSEAEAPSVLRAYIDALSSYGLVTIDTSSITPDDLVRRMLEFIPMERCLNGELGD